MDNGQTPNGANPTGQPPLNPQPAVGPDGVTNSETSPVPTVPSDATAQITPVTPSSQSSPVTPVDPTKQAIFTPNPEVPTEASAGNVLGAQAGAFGASEMNSTGPAHPFFSNHPTQTFASGAGDIIINHGSAGRPKTSRKPLIIGGIIIAALVVVLVGVIVAFGGKKERGSESEGGDSFGQYANHILYSTTNKTLSGNYDPYYDYALTEQTQSEEVDEAWWTTTKDLLDIASTDILAMQLASDDNEKDTISGFLRQHEDGIAFLSAYQSVKEFDIDALISYYLSSNADNTKEHLNQLYTPLEETKSNVAIGYARTKVQEYSMLADALNKYREYGCLKPDGIIEYCADHATEIDSELAGQMETVYRLDGEASDRVDQLLDQLESSCWQIRDNLKTFAKSKENKK